jgi:protein-tyrosine-phosphatase
MATAIFHDIVAKDSELSNAGIEAKSAGTLDGITGRPATHKARRVMQERGLDVTSHRAEEIRPDLAEWADLLLVMEHWHIHKIVGRFPDASEKVHLLTKFAAAEGNIDDPVLYGIDEYRECVALLESVLTATAERLKTS